MIVPSCVYKEDKKYRFVLTGHFEMMVPKFADENLVFYSKNLRIAELKDGKLRVFKGFSWDGCSPSHVFGFKWLSVPTPIEALAASLVHDLFYQYLLIDNCPWDREFADDEFKRLLELNRFEYSCLYYQAVHLFGGFFTKKNKDLYIGLN